jgi:hypothetical protein
VFGFLTKNTGQKMQVAPGHRLLPPERWFASLILERQRTHRTSAILRVEQNYGSEGIALLAAAILVGFAGALVGCSGFIFLFLAAGHGPLVGAGYWCFLAAIVLESAAVIRGLQCARVGRRFRGDRPFVKRP